MKETFDSLPSFSEDQFSMDDPLGEAVIQSIRDPICLNIPNIYCRQPPGECKMCSQIYCSLCLQLLSKNGAKCPNCLEHLEVGKVNEYLKNILTGLSLHCHFQSNGCSVSLPIKDLIKHESICQYESIKCPIGCEKEVLKKFMKEHTENECPKQIIQCRFQPCPVKLQRSQILHHENGCKYKEDFFIRQGNIGNDQDVDDDAEGEEGEEEKCCSCFNNNSSSRTNRDSPTNISNQAKPKYSPLRNMSNLYSENANQMWGLPPTTLVKCKNFGCYYTGPEETMGAHLVVCYYKVSSCKYSTQGCSYKSDSLNLVLHESKCKYKKCDQHDAQHGRPDPLSSISKNPPSMIRMNKENNERTGNRIEIEYIWDHFHSEF